MLHQVGLRRLALAAALVGLLALAPGASADHEFSHRVEVHGRVVDAEGHPVPGARVNATFHGIDAPLKCFDAKDERTNERGDLHVCRHYHELPAGVEATIEVLGASARVGIDPHLRRAYVALQLDAPSDVRSIQGERAFFRNVTVSARVVDALPAPVKVEAVTVPGVPRAGALANVTLADASGGVLAAGNATTSEFGDLRLDLPIAELPQGARVRIELGFATRTGELNASSRRADFAIVHTVEAPIPPPGSNTPLPALLAVGGVALAALLARRR